MSIYRYTVTYWADYLNAEDTEKGFVAAESMSDAAAKLCGNEEGYSEVYTLTLHEAEDTSVITDADIRVEMDPYE